MLDKVESELGSRHLGIPSETPPPIKVRSSFDPSTNRRGTDGVTNKAELQDEEESQNEKR